jgi:hypothetical protein
MLPLANTLLGVPPVRSHSRRIVVSREPRSLLHTAAWVFPDKRAQYRRTTYLKNLSTGRRPTPPLNNHVEKGRFLYGSPHTAIYGSSKSKKAHAYLFLSER